MSTRAIATIHNIAAHIVKSIVVAILHGAESVTLRIRRVVIRVDATSTIITLVELGRTNCASSSRLRIIRKIVNPSISTLTITTIRTQRSWSGKALEVAVTSIAPRLAVGRRASVRRHVASKTRCLVVLDRAKFAEIAVPPEGKGQTLTLAVRIEIGAYIIRCSVVTR